MNFQQEFSLFRWVFDSFWGWLLGIILILVLSSFFDSIGIEHLQFYVGVGVITGISLAQFRHMRHYFQLTISWMIWSIVSFSIPFIVIDGIKYSDLYPFSQNSLVYSVIIGTLSLSMTQYYGIKKSKSKPLTWFILSMAGWSCAGIATFALEYTPLIIENNLIVFIVNVLLILSGGVFIGIFTGMAAKKLLTAMEKE